MRLDSIRILDPPVARRPTVSQWPVTRARQLRFDLSACCNVRACASLARRTRVVRACRACSARVCSCASRGAGQQPAASQQAGKPFECATCLCVRDNSDASENKLALTEVAMRA